MIMLVIMCTTYTLTSVAFIPTATSLANIFGRKPTMLGALAFFGTGSAICAAAPSMNVLIAGRSVQGVGAGALVAVSQMILADLTSLAERGTYLGLLGLVCSVAAIFGPLIGAGFAVSGNWRGLFYMNLPIVAVCAILCSLYLNISTPELTFDQKMDRMDWTNVVFIAASASFTIGLSFGGVTYAWSSWQTLVPLVLGAAAMGLWLYLETLAKYPTVPWEILRHQTSLSGYVQIFLQSTIHLYIKWTQSYISPCNLGWVLTIIGAALLSLLTPSSSAAAWAGLPIMIGSGLGILSTGINFAVQAPLAPKLQPAAAGFYILVRTFGQLMGVTIGATIFQNELAKKVPAAFLATVPDPSVVAFAAIPSIELLEVRLAFSESIQMIWFASVGFGVVGLVASLLMERIELSTLTAGEFEIEDKWGPHGRRAV
ncbi:hypothetical protein RQP46_010338 [Phenoliferia psychrophenolica]